MGTDRAPAERVIDEIPQLPHERLAEVWGIVDFLAQRPYDQLAPRDMARAVEPAFAAVWDNPDDDAPNRL